MQSGRGGTNRQTRVTVQILLPLFFALLATFSGTDVPETVASSPPDHEIPTLVFVSRNPPKEESVLPGFGPRDRTARVGGRLMMREEGGRITDLLPPQMFFDVADPCVSWDAQRVAFSGLQHPDSNWRIFEFSIPGQEVVQRTFTDRMIDLTQFGAASPLFSKYDDFDPCYLPDGRMVCASTRYPSMSGYDQHLTSNLFVIPEDEGLMRRVTTERNGGEEPTIDPVTGRIVYARWWLNRDLPSNAARHGVTRDRSLALTDDVANIWQALSIRSDGEGMKLYAGFARTREGTQTYKPSVMPDGRLLSVFSPHTSLSHGTGGTGVRWFKAGTGFEHHVIGAQSDLSGTQGPWATDPVHLEGEKILISYAEDGTDFSIYSCNLDGTGLTLVLDLPGTFEMEPQVLVPREPPPVLMEEFPYPTGELPPTEDPETYFRNDTFRFDCMNIFTNGPVDDPMPDAPRIAVGARIRFFMNVQRQNPEYPDPSIFLKDAEVFLTGAVHEHDLPADVPLFEQVVDRDGNVLQTTDGRFAHVTGMNFDRMGSGTRCVGCHAGHSVLPVPKNGSQAEWVNLAPSAGATASSNGRLPDGSLSAPQRIVDRRARIGGRTSFWMSDEPDRATISLSWAIPIEVREFVLYGIQSNEKELTDLAVHVCELLLYYQNRLVSREGSTAAGPDGPHLKVAPAQIDSVAIRIRRTSGAILGKPVVGLAEVETIARISSLNYHSTKKGSE